MGQPSEIATKENLSRYKGFFFFFPLVRMVNHWDKLPRQTAESPTSGIFRACLGKALSILVLLDLLQAGTRPDAFTDPFQLKLFYNSYTYLLPTLVNYSYMMCDLGMNLYLVRKQQNL